MASTYSPNLRLELVGTGEQQGTWGATTNTNLGTLLEEAIGGYVSVTVSNSGDTTLTTNDGSADQSRNMVLNLTGTISAARTVICPAIEKLYVVKNATTGGFDVTFKVSGQTGVTIPNGSTYFLYVDGTDARLINGTIASQNANNVSITGGSISGVAISNGSISGAAISNGSVSNTSISNASVVANASSLSVRDADGSHILSFAAGSNLTANRVFTITTGDAARTLDISSGNVTISTAGANLIDDADASAQRTTLGLGTIATQNADNVSVTGGSITGITDLALADGGTGASLSDPGENAILGWNDTANVMRFFTAGTGILINATSNTISSLSANVQTFTSSGDWTKPSGAQLVLVRVWGAGCGGGRGANQGAGSNKQGGIGGAGGAYFERLFRASDLPSTVAVTVGAGGAGAAGLTNTIGGAAAGSAGGNSSFGSYVLAEGGQTNRGGHAMGGGGTASSGVTQWSIMGGVSVSGTPTVAATNNGYFGGGGPSWNSESPGSSSTGTNSAYGGGSGGSGGGENSSNVLSVPTAGGVSFATNSTAYGLGGAAGTSNASSPTNGSNGTALGMGGGGGGSTQTATNAGNGGNGGIAGGGGGGGSNRSGSASRTSGAGGNGGAGYVEVITW